MRCGAGVSCDTVESDDVEANRRRRRDDLSVIGGDAPQRCALSSVDGAKRGPERTGITAFDFDDHQRRPIQAHRIDLTAGQADVAR